MAPDDRTGVARSLEWARTLQAIAQSGLRYADDRVPELSAVRVTRAQVTRLFDHLRNPEWPTDFD